MARPRQVSDKQILAAARACFLEHGASVSTTVIADRLGISQPALFKRFGTKDRLLIAAMRPSLGPVAAFLDRGPDERPIPEQLLEIASRLREFGEKLVPLIDVLHEAGLAREALHRGDEPPPPVQVQRALSGWLERAQADGRIAPGDTEAVALAFVGAIQGRVFMAHHSGGPVSPLAWDGYLESFVQFAWQGIAPEEEP
jgi:AcrR family transcriptional regulator